MERNELISRMAADLFSGYIIAIPRPSSSDYDETVDSMVEQSVDVAEKIYREVVKRHRPASTGGR